MPTMKTLTFALTVGLAICVHGYTESNELNQSPKNMVTEKDLMSKDYDLVIFVGDSYKNLPPEMEAIGEAIASYLPVRSTKD